MEPGPHPSQWKFEVPRWLRNGHVMTFAGALWPRQFPWLPAAVPWLLEVEPGTSLRLDCHWQPPRPAGGADRAARPVLVLVHGLEGSSESRYILGTAEKAWRAGWSVIRQNVRNCGGTEHLTPTLYHSGLSGDVAVVVQHLIEDARLTEVHIAGFSMGGNQVLKLASEWGDSAPPAVASFAAVSPSLDLAACADALERPANFLYQWDFTSSLKRRLRRKARLFPERYQTNGLAGIRTVRQFDDRYTAPHFGFGPEGFGAANYYAQASARPHLARIARPTLILAASDDPFIPIASFRDPAVAANPHITLVTPDHGGHVGFIGRASRDEDRFWAENRVVEFCRAHSRC
jgi:predicted alpha/beta-fold hydrolase